MSHKAMKQAAQAGGIQIADWQDLERADKMARRAAGLESDEAPKVNVQLNLVNQRIRAMQQNGH